MHARLTRLETSAPVPLLLAALGAAIVSCQLLLQPPTNHYGLQHIPPSRNFFREWRQKNRQQVFAIRYPNMTTSAAAALIIAALLLFHSSSTWVISYQHTSCHRTARRTQFQFANCYTYDLNPDLYISDASFVMAHNAATGYIHGNDRKFNTNAKTSTNVWNKNDITLQLLSLYGKTQVGTAYQQLNDGARALDLRPKLYTNGTVGFHHGSLIDVPLTSLTLGRLLQDVKRWCYDNPTELVLLFHSELVHESGIDGLSSLVKYSANMDENNDDDGNNQEDEYYYSGIAKLKSVYREFGVPYQPCTTIAGLTVGQVMEMANLSTQTSSSSDPTARGYLLAMDRHDMYASFCGKSNWVESQQITCHSRYYDTNNQNTFLHCTDNKASSGMSKLTALQSYTMSSANNDASDNYYTLGPPADMYYYPFYQIQGLWQVDTESAQIGLMSASNLLEDNSRSNINAQLVSLVYAGNYDHISLFTMDNVALNGNAMFSVLRNACAQQSLISTRRITMTNDDDVDALPCGRDLPMPKMIFPHNLPLVYISCYLYCHPC